MKNKILPTIVVGLALLSLVDIRSASADGNDPATNTLATPVQVISSQATTNCIHAAAAAGAQATATFPSCGAGQYAYITYAESCYSAIAAPVATLMATTTTNIGTSFGWSQPMQAAVGDNCRTATFTVPLKTTAAGTATTLVGNSLIANISQNMKLCGFCAR